MSIDTFKKIKYVLNNESGGPQLEQMLALAGAFGVIAMIWKIGLSFYNYYYDTPSRPGLNRQRLATDNILMGYIK